MTKDDIPETPRELYEYKDENIVYTQKDDICNNSGKDFGPGIPISDQVGTLLQICDESIFKFIKNKVKFYGDSIKQISEQTSSRLNKDFTTSDIISILISLKIERIKHQFSNNLDYSDSLCDLLSYNWILNNQDKYFEMVNSFCKK